MIKRIVQAVSFALALSSTAAFAATETPTSAPGIKVISIDEGKALGGGKATFVDTRNAMNFGKGHVPGAISASYKEKSEQVPAFDSSKDEFDFAKLPADKNAQVVFYSDGPTGWKSYKAAVLASKGGWKNVMYMRAGFAEWQAKGLPIEH